MGHETYKIPMRLFGLNRERLRKRLKDNESIPSGAVVLLEGGKETTRYCSDSAHLFRQVNGVSETFSIYKLLPLIRSLISIGYLVCVNQIAMVL